MIKVSREECVPPPDHCARYEPKDEEIVDIVNKTGMKLSDVKIAFSDHPASEKGRGLGPAQQNVAATSIMILIAGGMAILAGNAAANFLVYMRVLPALCGQNIVQHTTRKVAATFGFGRSCEQVSGAHAAKIQSIIAVCGGLGVLSSTVRDFFKETHDVVKAVLFGTPKQQKAASRELKKAQALEKRTAHKKKEKKIKQKEKQSEKQAARQGQKDRNSGKYKMHTPPQNSAEARQQEAARQQAAATAAQDSSASDASVASAASTASTVGSPSPARRTSGSSSSSSSDGSSSEEEELKSVSSSMKKERQARSKKAPVASKKAAAASKKAPAASKSKKGRAKSRKSSSPKAAESSPKMSKRRGRGAKTADRRHRGGRTKRLRKRHSKRHSKR
jgi:hypothetical protein